jgi:hypothetical protein
MPAANGHEVYITFHAFKRHFFCHGYEWRDIAY